MSSRRRNLNALVLSGVAAAMLGVSFWSPTLYRLFCQGTGYEGTPKTENVVHSTQTSAAQVTVRFDANVNSALPWRFQPAQREVHLRLGEETLIHYTAANLSDQPITGTATFNVVPDKAGVYFSKLECFCFTEQTLAPGQEVSMPVVFYVDPGLAEDPTTRDVSTITLSYTFYRPDIEPKQPDNTAAIAGTRAVQAGG
ncbi:MAG: cytochrome c oxidase assembly protein [Rhodospirillales bacterium]|nr:cytochrome c oxidase assembly protein [Rhodospirillales bacterium]